jgi:colanic acid/amylovoran biosynthesis glycosyltransferase
MNRCFGAGMERICYLLHQFPRPTDTFIRREIRSLQKSGTCVKVISIWKPKQHDSSDNLVREWASDTQFALPRSSFSIFWILLVSALSSPIRFVSTIQLALSTSRPGLRGFVYQSYYFVEAAIAASLLRQNAITHVHNHIGDHSGTITMLAARLVGISYSITFHGWPVFFDAKYSRIKEKVRGARFTRSISYFCRSQLMMFSECDDPASYKIVHCGLEIDKYHYRPPRREINYLLCIARLSPEKGLTSLIRALKILKDEGYNLELRLGGDGPMREQLKALTNEIGIAEQVHFLGYLTENEVGKELYNSDLFVLPSFVEGLPVSAMEAMAIGLPVIATNVGGTSELIEDGRTGILVRPSDPQSIAAAILKMIDDYPFRLSAAQLGRQKILEEFDIEKETAKLNQYFIEGDGKSQ